MESNKELALELRNVLNRLRKSSLEGHKNSKLKGAGKQMLFLIANLKDGEPVMPSEIASKLGITLSAITHQINALEDEGLIKRGQNKNDRRVIYITLSAKGKRQIDLIKKEFSKKIEYLTEYLGNNDTNHLIRLVKKITDFPAYIKENNLDA